MKEKEGRKKETVKKQFQQRSLFFRQTKSKQVRTMIDKTEEKKMTGKMMMRKSGLALLGLVIGMAFMGTPSVAAQPAPATGGHGHGGPGKDCHSKPKRCQQCCKKKSTPEEQNRCAQGCPK